MSQSQIIDDLEEDYYGALDDIFYSLEYSLENNRITNEQFERFLKDNYLEDKYEDYKDSEV